MYSIKPATVAARSCELKEDKARERLCGFQWGSALRPHSGRARSRVEEPSWEILRGTPTPVFVVPEVTL